MFAESKKQGLGKVPLKEYRNISGYHTGLFSRIVPLDKGYIL